MERLTHEADFGLEDWEETLFFVKSDPNGAYNIIDIAKYQGEPEFDEILKNVALRLAAYENTGLGPEEIVKIRDALAGLQAENEEMQKKLNEFSEFLCHMTGGLLSKTNYTAQEMISAAEDYQQRVCDNDCALRADLARVTAERDGAKSPEVLEAVDELVEFARTRMCIADWLYYVDVLGGWRGQKED